MRSYLLFRVVFGFCRHFPEICFSPSRPRRGQPRRTGGAFRDGRGAAAYPSIAEWRGVVKSGPLFRWLLRWDFHGDLVQVEVNGCVSFAVADVLQIRRSFADLD